MYLYEMTVLWSDHQKRIEQLQAELTSSQNTVNSLNVKLSEEKVLIPLFYYILVYVSANSSVASQRRTLL